MPPAGILSEALQPQAAGAQLTDVETGGAGERPLARGQSRGEPPFPRLTARRDDGALPRRPPRHEAPRDRFDDEDARAGGTRGSESLEHRRAGVRIELVDDVGREDADPGA